MDPNQPPSSPSAPQATPTPSAVPQATPVAQATPQKKNPLSDLLFKIQFMAKVGQFKLLKILLIVLFLVFVLVGGAMAATVYTDIKLPILHEQKNNLTLMFYKIPLIPKNPEQI